MQTFTW